MAARDHPHMTRHPLAGGLVDVAGHACPECPLGTPAPLCPVCLGAGIIDTDRLARWQYEHEQRVRRGDTP